MPITRHKVGASTVRQLVFISDTLAVDHAPALRGKLAVDVDAREGFVGRLHGS